MAVIGELLMRLCNAAVPEVDEGQDILAFVADLPSVARLQVKTANAEALKEEGRYAARVSVPLAQLRTPTRVQLYFAFAVRLADHWVDFVVISRPDLHRMATSQGVGYHNQKAGELQLYLSFGPTTLLCSGQDLQPYRNAWHQLPVWGEGVPLADPSPPAAEGLPPQG
jgi:hypothetical protein